MLNAVGLQNKGVHYFVEHIYPQIKDIKTNFVVNVSGAAVDDYVQTAAIVNDLEAIPAIELNISCPNVKKGGMAFGVTAKGAEEVVSAVRKVYGKTLIVKLSPNVTDITEIARAAEAGGADSVSLINTLLGMAIDAERRRPVLSTVTGGTVWSGREAHCVAHGMAGSQGSKDSRHRTWRYYELEGCRGVSSGRGFGGADRNGQFRRPRRDCEGNRGH